MSTTTITGTIHGVNNAALANKWISFRLVQLGTDSAATVTVAQSVDSVQTDVNGDFSIDIWNNGDSGKRSILEITIDGSKAEYVIIPTGVSSIELWNLIENYSLPSSSPQASSLFAPIDNPTFTGTINTSATGIDFDPGTIGGELSWNNTEKTLDLITGSDNVTLQLGQEVVLYCRNKTGADIIDGQIVKIVGAQGDTPNIELAIASNTEEAHRTIGVATQTIPANSGKGFITLVGKVRGLDLRTQDGFTEGGLVYLSDTIAGALTPIKPAIEVEIGHVLRLGQNNGTLGVFINNEASVYELQQDVIANAAAIAALDVRVTALGG